MEWTVGNEEPSMMQAELLMSGGNTIAVIKGNSTVKTQATVIKLKALMVVKPNFWNGLRTKHMKRSIAISRVDAVDISREKINVNEATLHSQDRFQCNET